MHTVCETFAFQAAAKGAGMTSEEIELLVARLAVDPQAGDVMKGTRGCRKLRFARPGGGKSGGYRVITFFGGRRLPVFLLTVFGKNEKANLTEAERNALGRIADLLIGSYDRKAADEGRTG